MKMKFGGNGGGGGKPYIRFGSSSSFSQTICRPDPENPGSQICKKVITHSSVDPETGNRTERHTESEDSEPVSGFGLPGMFFSGPSGFFGGRQSSDGVFGSILSNSNDIKQPRQVPQEFDKGP